MKKILFIINPISGGREKDNLIKYIEETVDKDKFNSTIVMTEHLHHGYEIAKKAKEENNYDIIVAAGGDGSINDVVNAIANTDIVFGIIPVGSGNGLARFLKIPLNYKKAVNLIFTENSHTIDTICVTSPTYPVPVIAANLVGIGFDALIAKQFAESTTRGFQTYSKIVLKDYPTYKPRTYKIFADNVEITSTSLFISFANSNQFGYNAFIAPHAKIDDGFIDISTVKKFPILSIPIYAQLLFTKRILDSSLVDCIKAQKITVLNNEDEWVNIDGEAYKLGKQLKIENIPHSLKVIWGIK